MRGRDWMAAVVELRCAVSWDRCDGVRQAHHAGRNRGRGRKSPDCETVSMCVRHHDALHHLNGAFKGWSGDQLRRWQDRAIAATQRIVSARTGVKPEDVVDEDRRSKKRRKGRRAAR